MRSSRGGILFTTNSTDNNPVGSTLVSPRGCRFVVFYNEQMSHADLYSGCEYRVFDLGNKWKVFTGYSLVRDLSRRALEYREVSSIVRIASSNMGFNCLSPAQVPLDKRSSYEILTGIPHLHGLKENTAESLRFAGLVMMLRESNSQGAIDTWKDLIIPVLTRTHSALGA